MRHPLPLAGCALGALLAFAAAAGAQTGDAATSTTDTATPGNPPAVVVSNADYVTKAAAGDLFEIESSRLALETSANAAVLAFARMMVDDHMRMSEAMKETVVGLGLDIPIPSAPGGAEAQKLNALRTAGNDFDRQYVGMQLQGHERALALHQAYAEAGENAELRALATTAVPVVTAHLEAIGGIAEPFMSNRQ